MPFLMAAASCYYYSSKLLIVSLITLFNSCSSTTTFTITNNCPYMIWPGTLAGSGTPQLATTGFQLDSGESIVIPSVPKHWSGQIWARTGCRFNAANIPGSLEGLTSCQTGDCGGRLECDGIGATPPASLFEITLGDEKDYYDVSLVDGYNVPLVVAPHGGGIGGGGCNVTGCITDINMNCPKELEVISGDGDETVSVVGCKSACEAFGSEQYCCSGEYANPGTCGPSMYSGMFKKACPRAYTYAFDDGTSTFTCSSPSGYFIVFCPNSRMRRIDDPPLRESQREKIGAGIVSASSSVAVAIFKCPLLPLLPIFVAIANFSL